MSDDIRWVLFFFCLCFTSVHVGSSSDGFGATTRTITQWHTADWESSHSMCSDAG